MLLDFIVWSFLANYIICLYMYMCCIAVYFCTLFSDHFTYGNVVLQKALFQLRQGKLGLEKTRQSVLFFVSENTRGFVYLTTANNELWSWLTMTVFASQLPSNIYTIYRSLDVHSLKWNQTVLNWFIMGNQFGMLILSLLFIARNAKSMQDAHSTLASLQCHLQGTGKKSKSCTVWLKLKCMQLYERLNSNTAIGISIGPFECITYSMVFEIVLIYFAYIFFLFDFLN